MRPRHYQRRRRLDLTPRQREVIALMAEGRTNGEIGEQLGITLDGAKAHVREIMAKLEATSRQDAVQRWRASEGLLKRLGRTMNALVPSAAIFRWSLMAVGTAVAAATGAGLILLPDGGSPVAGESLTVLPTPTAISPPPPPPVAADTPAATATTPATVAVPMPDEVADAFFGPTPTLPVTSENPLDVLPGLGGGGVLVYVSERRSLPNPPRSVEDMAFATIYRTFVHVTLVDAEGRFEEEFVAQLADGNLLWAHFERDGYSQEVGESSWMMYEDIAWGMQGVQGPYGSSTINELVSWFADMVLAVQEAEAGGEVVRSSGDVSGLDVISLRMLTSRWSEQAIVPFADEPNWVLAQEARDCARYQSSNHGGFRTLELQVPEGGFLPLHVGCTAAWPTEVEAWSIRREWSALPADAWESVIRQYAPDFADEVFD